MNLFYLSRTILDKGLNAPLYQSKQSKLGVTSNRRENNSGDYCQH
jgi:hypothetical protein